MDIKVPRGRSSKDKLVAIQDQKKGSVSLLDETRLQKDQVLTCENMMQTQDGILQTRWGRQYYGEAIAGETSLDGGFEYILDRGKTTEEHHIIVIGATGTAYKSDDDGDTWTTLTGTTYTAGSTYSTAQIDEHLFIANGEDSLSRYDGSDLVTYDGIDIPTGLALGRATIADGSLEAFYQVTALNEIGETAGCTEVSITHTKERDLWVSGEGINLTWTAVTGASRYQVYYSDESGYESLIASTTTNSYDDVADTDDATNAINPYIVTPVSDTTIGPSFKHIILSGNRIWGTNDAENPFRVYFSGVGQYVGYFSAFYGGGWVDLEWGGKESMMGLADFRTGKGDSVSTVMTKHPDGTGSIWQIALDTIQAGDLNFTVPIPTKVVEYIGCTSYKAIVNAGEKVFFPNINGIFTLGNREQLLNILVSDEISQAVRPDFRNLNQATLSDMVGYYYDGNLFWSASVGGTNNDLIFIYDTERKVWTWKWTFGVRDMFSATDVDNRSHMLYLPTTGNQLIEISKNFDTDFGGEYKCVYESGLHEFDDDMQAFAKVHEVVLELGRLKGTVDFEIRGLERRGPITTLTSSSFTDSTSTIDFANALWGDYAFSDDDEVPVTFRTATLRKRMRVNKKLYRMGYRVSSASAGTSFSLLGMQAVGRIMPTAMPNEWK